MIIPWQIWVGVLMNPPIHIPHRFTRRFARFVINKTNTLAGTPEYMAPEASERVIWSYPQLSKHILVLIWLVQGFCWGVE